MDRLGEIQAFVKVAETGSFAGAARKLRRDPSSISRAIGSLETRLGVRLIARTSRNLSLTDEGSNYFKRCSAILDDIDAADEEAKTDTSKLAGSLRIVGINAVSAEVIMPFLKDFLSEHREIRLQIDQVTSHAELNLSDADLCLAIGELPVKGATTIPLIKSSRVVCASPSYIQQYGRPTQMSDLADHNCLGFSRSQRSDVWAREEDGETEVVRISGNLLANNAEMIRQAALAGIGICRLSDFIVGPDIEAGRLVALFPDQLRTAANHVCAVVPSAPQIPKRTALLIEHLQLTLSANTPA